MRRLTLDDVFNASELMEMFNLPEVYVRLAKADRNDPVGFAVQSLMVFMKQAGTDQNRQKIYEFLAGPFEKTAAEMREMPFVEIAKGIVQIADVKEWQSFLSSVRNIK